MARFAVALAALALAVTAGAVQVQTESEGRANPIRKVVTLLQSMQKKVTEEGEKEKELYGKFMCYCKHGNDDLAKSISDAETKAPAVGSRIEESEGRLEQAKLDLKSAQEDRSSAEAAIAEAVALREKEAVIFNGVKSEADTNIAALDKAVAALEKGMAGSFLQTEAAQVIRRLSIDEKLDLGEADRQDLAAFLSQSSGYAPSSGSVVGILKQMRETMAKDLDEATETEKAAKESHASLVAAKEKEVHALSASVEAKTAQIGELGVQITQMKGDLSDTQAALLEDRKFLEELQTSCGTKTKEWEERSKTRQEELVALADTIKVLNDDDALDFFRKTLPAPAKSLMQIGASSHQERASALQLLHAARGKVDPQQRSGLDLIALVLAGKRSLNQGTFDKVIKMCDEMIATLKREQDDDDHKKEYCGLQFDTSDDSRKELDRRISDAETAMANAKEGVATLTEEISNLEAGIKALDKSVEEATEQRQEENKVFKELMSSDSAAKDLLSFAKNRLNKFYNPKLHKPAATKKLSEEDRIFANNGGELAPEKPLGGIAGTGITALTQVATKSRRSVMVPPPPPATWDAYQTQAETGNGVLALIDMLIKDLTKEMTEAEADEQHAQEDYKTLMADAAEKRATDSKALTGKAATKADLEAELQAHSDSHKAAVGEMMALEKYIASLHFECDWLLKYWETRKAARSDEIDSLGRAKAVLSGADYSLLQTRSKGFLWRRL